jgi:hypothetical protein
VEGIIFAIMQGSQSVAWKNRGKMHQIVSVAVRENTLVYTCSCGEKFIGPGIDTTRGAKLPDTLIAHLESKKGE